MLQSSGQCLSLKLSHDILAIWQKSSVVCVIFSLFPSFLDLHPSWTSSSWSGRKMKVPCSPSWCPRAEGCLPKRIGRNLEKKKKRYVNLCMCAWPRHKSRNLWRRLQALRAIDVLKEICRGFGSDCRSKGWMTARNVIKHKNAVHDLQTKLWKLLDFANTVQYFALLTQTSKTSVFHFCFAISRPKTFSPSVPHREKGRSIIHHHVPSASRVIARDMVWHDEAPNTSLLVMSYYLSCTMQVVLFHGVNLNQLFVVYRCAVQLVFLSYHLDSVALKYHFRFHFVASFRLSEIGGASQGSDDGWLWGWWWQVTREQLALPVVKLNSFQAM